MSTNGLQFEENSRGTHSSEIFLLGKPDEVRDPRAVTEELTKQEIRSLKARAPLLRATVFIGKEGLSPTLLKSLDDALARHELVKVKFMHLKDQKKELVPVLAEKAAAHLIARVGNVAVLFRRKLATTD